MPYEKNETDCFTVLWYSNCSTLTTTHVHGTTCDVALYFLQIISYIVILAYIAFFVAFLANHFIRRRRQRQGQYATTATV